MLSTRPLQSICTACRSKILAAGALDAGSRTLSASSRTNLHKRIRLSPPQRQHAPSRRPFSAATRNRSQTSANSNSDDATTAKDDASASNEPLPPPPRPDESNTEAEQEEGAEEERERKRTPAELEAAARNARQAYGDVLPEACLTAAEFAVYERLYGAPLRVVSEEELVAEAQASAYEEPDEGERVRDTLWVEGKSGKLEEVEFYQGAPEVAREFGEEVVLEDDYDAEERDHDVEGLSARMGEMGFEEVEEEVEERDWTAEELRAHPLTVAGRFATAPSTVQLPKAAFVEPVSEMLGAASKKHLTDVASRVFGGHRLPHSTATPRPMGGELVQKPIPLDPSQPLMKPMEGDSYLAAVMPGTYAAVTSILVEVRKRLGSGWLEGLLQKEGGPLILDASSGGAAVVAWREILGAEWERMEEESGERSPAPLGKASVITGSDTMRHRAARFLENTTFLPRLPDPILPGEKVGPKARKVYDIVVAPHYLWSLPEDYLRKAAVQKLWSLLNPQGGVLILLEKGLPRGFEVIAGARSLLLDNHIASPGSTHVETAVHDVRNQGRFTQKEPGMIVAPCTNHAGCPMYTVPGVSRNRKDFCYFKQRYIRPPYLQRLLGARDRNHEDVQFSYLAVRRGGDLRRVDEELGRAGFVQGEEATLRAFEGHGDRHRNPLEDAEHDAEEAELEASSSDAVAKKATEQQQQPVTEADAAAKEETDEEQHQQLPTNELTLTLPRLILPPLKRRGHVIVDVCTPAGRLERWTVPKSFGRQAYRDARKARWGDLWALGAATRVQRQVRLGKGKGDADDGKALGRLVQGTEAGVDVGGKKVGQRLSKEDKKRLKKERGRNWKKGKETRRMERERRDGVKGSEEEEEDEDF